MRLLSGDQAPKVAARADLQLAQLADEQNGVVATRQLAAREIDSGAIAVRVSRGQLYRVHRGVYAVGRSTLTLKGELTAAALAGGQGATLGYHAAGAWWSMLAWDHRRPEVIVPHSAGRAITGIRARRTRVDPRDVWRRDNILVTSPARTVLDLAAELAPKALRRMVRQAFAEGIVSVRQLTDVLDRTPRHRGAAKLRALLADGYVPTRSELEDRALDLLAAAAIERPEVNPRLVIAQRAIRPDLLWRDTGVVVELDGARWHDDPLTRADDADKQAALEADGYRVLRMGWRQLVDHPKQTIARVRTALGLET